MKLRVYLSPADTRRLEDCVALFPQNMVRLTDYEVELVRDDRITPGFALATIDGAGSLGA